MFGAYNILEELAQTIHVPLVKESFINFSPAGPWPKLHIEAVSALWESKLNQGSGILWVVSQPWAHQDIKKSSPLTNELNANKQKQKTEE